MPPSQAGRAAQGATLKEKVWPAGSRRERRVMRVRIRSRGDVEQVRWIREENLGALATQVSPP